MKMKLAQAAVVAVACTLVTCMLVSCGNSSHAKSTRYLIAIDNSGAGTNVNVFPVNASTGVPGAAITNSPFDMGLTDAVTIEVHPNGHFAYVADGIDGSIHSWDVNESTGVPTEVGTAQVNTSGSFYEPCCSDAPTHVITVTPNGKYLYSANNDANVGAYMINADGSLTHIADLNIGACDTGAITATDSFVWVTDTCSGTSTWFVYTLKIGADGSLTNSSNVQLTGVYAWLWSIQVNPVSQFVYVGDEGGDAQIYSFSYDANGALTQLGPQLVENSSSDCRFIAHSPDGKNFYTSDDDDVLHALSVNTSTGAITELGNSPYTPGGGGQVATDATGHYVYIAGGDVYGYSRNTSTGALTAISDTTTANTTARAIGLIR